MPAPLASIAATLPATVPFTGPETLERERGKRFVARIGANESALGPSPLARAAMQWAMRGTAHGAMQGAMHGAIQPGPDGLTCSRYGDPENALLKAALAARHDVDAQNLVIDAGIDALLGLTVRLLLEPGGCAVSSLGAYPTFAYHVIGHGARLHAVPYRDTCEDPEALACAACEQDASLVYLSNPDNPMGTCVTATQIEHLLELLPENCTLLLDEAYVDYLAASPNPPIDIADPRLIRYRTFSKAWGLAGLRIGYAIAHSDTAAAFDRVRNHFAVNTLAQTAALASLQDATWLAQVRQETAVGRLRIESLAQRCNLTSVPSSTNFVTVDLGSRSRAERVLAFLADASVFVRKPQATPLDRYVRIGIGTPAEMDYLESAFPDALGQADASLQS